MAGAGIRSWLPSRQITLTVVTAVVAGGVAAVAKWPHAWWWVVIIAAVVAAMVLPALAQVAQRWQDIEGIMRAGFKGTTGPAGASFLPSVQLAWRRGPTGLSMPSPTSAATRKKPSALTCATGARCC